LLAGEPRGNGRCNNWYRLKVRLLEVRNLSKSYRGLVAVESLSFTVKGGELVALLGPNGAGKSTTLTCVAGFQRPDSGTVTWNGRRLGADRSRNIALVPETPEVFPLLTIWEHMTFVARGLDLPSGWQADAEVLLKRFEILEQRDKLGEALSKGMRQKLLVACAALAGTEVMFLDEPMVGLDPHAQRELRQMLMELKSAGRALMISSHLITYLEGLADRAVIIKAGRLVAEGTLDDLKHRYGSQDLEETFFEATT
jgi:ABC-2 type transport system ATP-binding protein